MVIVMPRRRQTFTLARERQYQRMYPGESRGALEKRFELFEDAQSVRLGGYYLKRELGDPPGELKYPGGITMGAFDNFEWDEEAQSGAEGEAYELAIPRPGDVGDYGYEPSRDPRAKIMQAGVGQPLLLAGGAALARYGPTLVSRLRALIPAMTPAVRNLLISMGLIGGASAVGSAFGSMAGDEIGEAPVPGEGESVGPFDIVRRIFGGGSGGPPGLQVAYTWDTGTAVFYRLTDGRIAVQRKNGIWKFYRPQKHIVVPRNPRIGTLLRADKRIDRLMTGLARKSKKLKLQ